MCYRPAGIRTPNVVVKRKATPTELARALGTSFELDEPQGVAGKQQPNANASDKKEDEVQAKILHVH